MDFSFFRLQVQRTGVHGAPARDAAVPYTHPPVRVSHHTVDSVRYSGALLRERIVSVSVRGHGSSKSAWLLHAGSRSRLSSSTRHAATRHARDVIARQHRRRPTASDRIILLRQPRVATGEVRLYFLHHARHHCLQPRASSHVRRMRLHLSDSVAWPHHSCTY